MYSVYYPTHALNLVWADSYGKWVFTDAGLTNYIDSSWCDGTLYPEILSDNLKKETYLGSKERAEWVEFVKNNVRGCS